MVSEGLFYEPFNFDAKSNNTIKFQQKSPAYSDTIILLTSLCKIIFRHSSGRNEKAARIFKRGGNTAESVTWYLLLNWTAWRNDEGPEVGGLGHCLQSRKLTLLNYLRLKSEGLFGGRKSLFESWISSLAPYYSVTRTMGWNTIPGISVSHETQPQTIHIHVQYSSLYINYDKQLRDLYCSPKPVIVTSYIAETVK
jgi:hypothetical protein